MHEEKLQQTVSLLILKDKTGKQHSTLNLIILLFQQNQVKLSRKRNHQLLEKFRLRISSMTTCNDSIILIILY